MMPSGQSSQTETTSSCYSSFFGLSPFALISFPSLQLTFVSYTSIHAGNSWASHSLTLSLINLPLGSFDPCTTASLLSLGRSEASLNKQHHQSEIWTWTLNRGLFSSGKSSIKRSNCIHWQMLWQGNTIQPVWRCTKTNESALISTINGIWILGFSNFNLQSWRFFLRTTSS